MKKLYFFNKIILLFFFGIFWNCKTNETNKKVVENKEIKPFLKSPTTDDVTYHEDTTKEYEYRTGTLGEYSYNYNVHGLDSDGNEVTGNITVEGKYGNGILTKANGEETEIDVEWIGYGKLLATDEEDIEYELYVNED